VERWPQAVAPAQGFLASANQQPIDPRQTRDYWGGSYDPWRALRIDALLRADSSVTVDDMRRWQTDRGSERANLFAPHFLRAAERAAARGGPDAERAREAGRLLAEWDRRYDPANPRAALFEAAMRELVARTWDELSAPARLTQARRRRPAPRRRRRRCSPRSSPTRRACGGTTAGPRPRGPRRDPRRQPRRGARPPHARRRRARRRRLGVGKRQHVNVNHLLRLPAFSRLDLPPAGGPGTLSPTTRDGTHSASWRMVVELGPEVRAWGTYPGGQSGDPRARTTPTACRGGSPASSTPSGSRAAPPTSRPRRPPSGSPSPRAAECCVSMRCSPCWR
jgi:penicillin amidase